MFGGSSRNAHVLVRSEGRSTAVPEDTFEESFGPYMRLGGKAFMLNLLNRGGPSPLNNDQRT